MRGTIIREIMRWNNQKNKLTGRGKRDTYVSQGKINKNKRNQKSENLIDLWHSIAEMIIQETDPNLTKYNEIMCATAKVMTVLCSDKNLKRKKTMNRQNKPMWKGKIEKEKINYMQDELSI